MHLFRKRINNKMLYHYETVTHILDEQHQKELAIQSEYQESNYTLTEPFVRLNPYGIAPLTALIMFHTESSVSVCVEQPDVLYQQKYDHFQTA